MGLLFVIQTMGSADSMLDGMGIPWKFHPSACPKSFIFPVNKDLWLWLLTFTRWLGSYDGAITKHGPFCDGSPDQILCYQRIYLLYNIPVHNVPFISINYLLFFLATWGTLNSWKLTHVPNRLSYSQGVSGIFTLIAFRVLLFVWISHVRTCCKAAYDCSL